MLVHLEMALAEVFCSSCFRPEWLLLEGFQGCFEKWSFFSYGHTVCMCHCRCVRMCWLACTCHVRLTSCAVLVRWKWGTMKGRTKYGNCYSLRELWTGWHTVRACQRGSYCHANMCRAVPLEVSARKCLTAVKWAPRAVVQTHPVSGKALPWGIFNLVFCHSKIFRENRSAKCHSAANYCVMLLHSFS